MRSWSQECSNLDVMRSHALCLKVGLKISGKSTHIEGRTLVLVKFVLNKIFLVLARRKFCLTFVSQSGWDSEFKCIICIQKWEKKLEAIRVCDRSFPSEQTHELGIFTFFASSIVNFPGWQMTTVLRRSGLLAKRMHTEPPYQYLQRGPEFGDQIPLLNFMLERTQGHLSSRTSSAPSTVEWTE